MFYNHKLSNKILLSIADKMVKAEIKGFFKKPSIIGLGEYDSE